MSKPEMKPYLPISKLFIQQYERYLPTAFDESLSVIEKINLVIQQLNRLGEVTNDVIEQWNKVMEWILNEGLKEEVSKILDKWVTDGTLAKLINKDLFNDLVIQFTNRLNEEVKKLNQKIDAIIQPSPVAVVDTVDELNSKWPNGRSGIVVVKADGFYYYYADGRWNKGAMYVDPLTYPVYNKNGYAFNLNVEQSWLDNPDITTLKSGVYSVYLQSAATPEDKINPNYPIAKNIPDQIDGLMCIIEVLDQGSDGRVAYRITQNWTNTEYTATKRHDGTMTEWSWTLRHNEKDRPLQMKRLTFANGVGTSWKYGTTDPAQHNSPGGRLVVPITSLDTGFYIGDIYKVEGEDNRQLPKDIPLGQVFSALIWKSDGDRKTIFLNATYTSISWIGYTKVGGDILSWKRIDKDVDEIENDKLEFAFRVNKIKNNNFKPLIITDVHGQLGVGATQITYVNPPHYQNVDDLDNLIHNNDCTIHLGDWLDGNYTKAQSTPSLVKFGKQFYSKPNRYGVYGNHDYNGQWDGNAGNNAGNIGDLAYYFTKEELNEYLTPFNRPYYHVDNDEKKIRMIYLSSFDQSFITGSNGRLISDPQNQRAFGGEQVLWFRDTLASVPEGYNVVIFTHETFDNIFEDTVYFNGDTMRKVAEGYQNKTKDTMFSSDITSDSKEWPYFRVDSAFDFTESHGKILGVISGHRHRDGSQIRAGIRYICLLCSRAESGTTEDKPPRNYYDKTQEAITYLDFDVEKEEIRLHRFGAGIDRTYKMFE